MKWPTVGHGRQSAVLPWMAAWLSQPPTTHSADASSPVCLSSHAPTLTLVDDVRGSSTRYLVPQAYSSTRVFRLRPSLILMDLR